MHLSLSSQPVTDRPDSGWKVASDVRNEVESGSVITARAFDHRLAATSHLTVALRGSHSEVALVHGAAVYMTSESFSWSAPFS